LTRLSFYCIKAKDIGTLDNPKFWSQLKSVDITETIYSYDRLFLDNFLENPHSLPTSLSIHFYYDQQKPLEWNEFKRAKKLAILNNLENMPALRNLVLNRMLLF
jgi:hypothetical protein